jgi:hypothetical protein
MEQGAGSRADRHGKTPNRPRPDIATVLGSVPLVAQPRRPPKESTINIRVAEQKKAEIKEIADLYGLSITDYLLQLHDHARSVLIGPKTP